MTTDEVLLQGDDVTMTDTCFGERAKPGVDAVNRRGCIASFDDRIDGFTRGLYSRSSLDTERDLSTSTRDVFEVGEQHGMA